MGRRSYVTALDIGTTKVAALVGEVVDSGETRVLGFGVCPSKGLRRGVVVDIESTVAAIQEAVEKAERMSGVRVKSVHVGISGSHASSVNNRGVVAVAREDKEITPEDVDRVIEASRVISLPPDREIVHVIPREFIVDGCDGIRDPVGMLGTRLEVQAHVVTGAVTSIQNLLRSVYKAGLDVEDVVLMSLASGEAVLVSAEKDLGVVLADIGGGTTDIAIFREGTLWFTSALPVGGDHVTGDIAVGLRTPIPQAEKVKIEHGVAKVDLASDDRFFEIPSVGGRGTREVSERMLASIVEPRLQEILGMLRDEVKRSGYEGIIPGGVVITGGTAAVRGLAELAADELDSPVRIGVPESVVGLSDEVNGPAFATLTGLVGCAGRTSGGYGTAGSPRQGVLSVLTDRVRAWFRDFF